MYNLLLRESFEVRPVHGRRRTEGPLQHRRPKDSSPAESIARERARSLAPVYIISSRTIFSRKFCFLHTFIATSPFCIVTAVADADAVARIPPHTGTRRRASKDGLSLSLSVCHARVREVVVVGNTGILDLSHRVELCSGHSKR